jgi:hypothetical protein
MIVSPVVITDNPAILGRGAHDASFYCCVYFKCLVNWSNEHVMATLSKQSNPAYTGEKSVIVPVDSGRQEQPAEPEP